MRVKGAQRPSSARQPLRVREGRERSTRRLRDDGQSIAAACRKRCGRAESDSVALTLFPSVLCWAVLQWESRTREGERVTKQSIEWCESACGAVRRPSLRLLSVLVAAAAVVSIAGSAGRAAVEMRVCGNLAGRTAVGRAQAATRLCLTVRRLVCLFACRCLSPP